MGQRIEMKFFNNGETQIHVNGIKGRKCTDATAEIENLLGGVVEREETSEMYEHEPEQHMGVNVK